MSLDFSEFHFIRPLWLLLIPLVVAVWLLIKRHSSAGQWQKYIPAEMVAALRVGADQHSARNSLLLLLASLLLVLALAGPSWEKQPVPALQNQHAMVIMLDLSPSMLAKDLKPNRLTLARFKLIDILRQQRDGQIALIAYAGGAHTVSPLTDDPRTIEALLPALNPSVMPSSGSNVEAAATLAQDLLRDAGATQGDLLLITDGVATDAVSTLESSIGSNYRLSILGVGSDEPTPIPASGGGFLKSPDGEIVLTELDSNQLRKLASSLGGQYAQLSNSDSDIKRLLVDRIDAETGLQSDDNTFDSWVDMGYLLVLLVLPIALLFFRKGVIYLLPLMFIMPPDASAQEQAANRSALSSTWQNLWATPDQQGAKLMQQERFANAAETFKRDDWSAVADYRAGNYSAAKEKWDGKEDVNSLYNRANATALAGDLDAAQELYEQVLEKQPDHAAAAHNKKVIEELKNQQQQSQQNQGDGENQNQDQDQEQQQNQEQSESQDQSSREQSQQQSQQNQSEDQQQAGGEQQDQQQNDQSAEQQSAEQEQQASSEQSAQEEAEQDQGQQDKPSEAEPATAEEPESDENGETAQMVQADDESDLDDASEQWLRTIKDDPSGLLRRKFRYQAEQNARNPNRSKPTTSEQRY